MRLKLRNVIGVCLLVAAMIYSAMGLIDPRTAKAQGGTCCAVGLQCSLGYVCCVVRLDCGEVPCDPEHNKNNYCKTYCTSSC